MEGGAMPTVDKRVRNTGLQYHLDLKPGDVGEYVLLPGDPARVDVFKKFVESPHEVAYKREYRTATGTYKGITVSCTSTGIGCPSTAIAVEELANIGVKTFIRIGSCAGLGDGVHPRDLIIATGSMRNEGTTSFYAPMALPAVSDFFTTQALIQAAEELKSSRGFNYHVGLSGADDAFYGETPEFISKLHDLGLKGVEMESAAIFIITHLRGLRGACICSVAANTYTAEALDPEAEKNLPSRFNDIIEISLEAIVKLYNK
jgi:uridine phosphorylase